MKPCKGAKYLSLIAIKEIGRSHRIIQIEVCLDMVSSPRLVCKEPGPRLYAEGHLYPITVVALVHYLLIP